MKKRLIDAMVNAFLGWRLPQDFYPNCHISFDREKARKMSPHSWPVGTNLFTAAQAREMFEHVVDKGIGLPTTEQAGNYLVEVCHGASAAAGWWGELEQTGDLPYDVAEVRGDGRFGKALVAQKLCLIHSEVSEAMEGHRKGLADDKLPHRPMVEVELADAVIRIADLAGALGLDLGGAIAEKLEYNRNRPDHKPENRKAEGGKKY